jgi:hypothetical protein
MGLYDREYMREPEGRSGFRASPLQKWLLVIVVLGVVSFIVARSANTPMPGRAGIWGEPVMPPLLEPFQGRWVCDQEQTYAAWRARGISEDVIAQNRGILRKMQEVTMPAQVQQALRSRGVTQEDLRATYGKMHPDIFFRGNVATSEGVLSQEYRLFGIHTHGDGICAKAWHHEDRFDPGDMSECFVRLKLVEGALHLQMRMKDGLPDLDDPDLTGTPPVISDSVADCQADAPPGPDWGDWTTYVFVRESGAEASDDQ